jgi:hypothetical protein
VLTIRSRSGQTHKVAFGAQTFNTGGFYARRLGRDGVYLVPRRPIDDLRSLIAGERIDSENIVDQKLRELDARTDADTEADNDSSWLKQALELESTTTTEAKP